MTLDGERRQINFFSLYPLNFQFIDGQNLMTVGHCLRDHGTETKNNFDSVTRGLK